MFSRIIQFFRKLQSKESKKREIIRLARDIAEEAGHHTLLKPIGLLCKPASADALIREAHALILTVDQEPVILTTGDVEGPANTGRVSFKPIVKPMKDMKEAVETFFRLHSPDLDRSLEHLRSFSIC